MRRGGLDFPGPLRFTRGMKSLSRRGVLGGIAALFGVGLLPKLAKAGPRCAPLPGSHHP